MCDRENGLTNFGFVELILTDSLKEVTHFLRYR